MIDNNIEMVASWMLEHASEYDTCTSLAEGAAEYFDIMDELDDPDGWIWELAIDYHRD